MKCAIYAVYAVLTAIYFKIPIPEDQFSGVISLLLYTFSLFWFMIAMIPEGREK